MSILYVLTTETVSKVTEHGAQTVVHMTAENIVVFGAGALLHHMPAHWYTAPLRYLLRFLLWEGKDAAKDDKSRH